jgi:hypothetical protein
LVGCLGYLVNSRLRKGWPSPRGVSLDLPMAFPGGGLTGREFGDRNPNT